MVTNWQLSKRRRWRPTSSRSLPASTTPNSQRNSSSKVDTWTASSKPYKHQIISKMPISRSCMFTLNTFLVSSTNAPSSASCASSARNYRTRMLSTVASALFATSPTSMKEMSKTHYSNNRPACIKNYWLAISSRKKDCSCWLITYSAPTSYGRYCRSVLTMCSTSLSRSPRTLRWLTYVERFTS